MSTFDENKLVYDYESFCVLPGVMNARNGMHHAPSGESINKRRLCVNEDCGRDDCEFFHLREGCIGLKSHMCYHSKPYQPKQSFGESNQDMGSNSMQKFKVRSTFPPSQRFSPSQMSPQMSSQLSSQLSSSQMPYRSFHSQRELFQHDPDYSVDYSTPVF